MVLLNIGCRNTHGMQVNGTRDVCKGTINCWYWIPWTDSDEIIYFANGHPQLLRFAKPSTTSRTICSMHISHVIRARVACASARLGCFIVTVGDWALREYSEIGHCSEGLRHCTETVESLGLRRAGILSDGALQGYSAFGCWAGRPWRWGQEGTLGVEQLRTLFGVTQCKLWATVGTLCGGAPEILLCSWPL